LTVVCRRRGSRSRSCRGRRCAIRQTRDAKRLIEEVGGDDQELAKPLGIEERELEAGGRN